MSAWIRLDANIFSDAKLRRVGPWGALVFFAALTYAKDQGHRGGRIPAEDFDAEMVALHVNTKSRSQEKAIARGFEECLRVGLLVRDSNAICVNRWSTFQKDPTNADRQQRLRDKRKGENGGERYSGEPSAGRVTERNEVTAYGTGRDSTDKTPPPPETGGDDPPSAVRIRPRDRQRFVTVLEYLVVCGRTQAEKERARQLRAVHREAPLDDEAIHQLLTGDFKWVTTERLARWKRAG